MASETFSVVALPHSCARRRRLPRVAVRRAARSTPTTPTVGKLGDFRLFPRLGRTRSRPRMPHPSCSTRSAPSRPSRCSTRLEPRPRGAPRSRRRTPVKGSRRPRLVGPASGAASPPAPCTTSARRMHLATMYADPTTPAGPGRRTRSPTACDGSPASGSASPPTAGDEAGSAARRRVYDESLIGTEDLDTLVESGEPLDDHRAGRSPPRRTGCGGCRSSCTVPGASTSDPSRKREYQERPDPGSATLARHEAAGAGVPRALRDGGRPPVTAAPARAGDRPEGRPTPTGCASRGGCPRGIAPRRSTPARAGRPACAAARSATTLVTVAEHRRLGRRRGPHRRRRLASPCSTSRPTAPRSRPSGSCGRCLGCSKSQENGDAGATPPPRRCAPAASPSSGPARRSTPRRGCDRQRTIDEYHRSRAIRRR